MKRDNSPLVIALVLFGFMVAVMLLAVDVAIGQDDNPVENHTFDGLDGWVLNNTDWVTHSLDQDWSGQDGSAKFLVVGGQILQSVTLSESGVHLMTFYGKADDPD